jgi:hypothetical protein
MKYIHIVTVAVAVSIAIAPIAITLLSPLTSEIAIFYPCASRCLLEPQIIDIREYTDCSSAMPACLILAEW